MNDSLFLAVNQFALATCFYSDQDLERRWTWQAYDEGVRYAFFRTYEELRELAARLAAERSQKGPVLTAAQQSLAQYHYAFRDLQAFMVGFDDVLGQKIPEEGEWSLQQAEAHVIEAERAFFALIDYAVERYRDAPDNPVEMPDEAWNAYWQADPFEEVVESRSLAKIQSYHKMLHDRVLHRLATVADSELQAPSIWWEVVPMSAEFRMHRLDAHMRQHTIHIEKILGKLGKQPIEARHLLRLIFSALAELEGTQIGAWELGSQACEKLAQNISSRTGEIAVSEQNAETL